jgi:hypothetical protein
LALKGHYYLGQHIISRKRIRAVCKVAMADVLMGK